MWETAYRLMITRRLHASGQVAGHGQRGNLSSSPNHAPGKFGNWRCVASRRSPGLTTLPKDKTRTVSGPGISLSSYLVNYRQRPCRSQHYFEEPARPKAPLQLPYQPGRPWTGRDSNPYLPAGQADVRPLHHGPSAGYGPGLPLARLYITPILLRCRTGTKPDQFRSVLPVFNVN